MKKKTIAIDWGNTRLKVGVFEDNVLQKVSILDCETALHVFLEHTLASRAILMATRTLPEDALSTLRKLLPTLHFQSTTKLPISHTYETPHTLGADRLATAVGAWHLFPQTDCLIIDAGTCITLDFLSSAGKFEGGNITLGVQMRFRALHEFTAKLPLVDMMDYVSPTLTGKNTRQALYNGAVGGALAEIENTIARYSNLFPSIQVLMCGGDADFLASLLKVPIFALPNLGLIGLNQILNSLEAPNR
jgi:type III pantothenate kinase